MSKSSQRIRRAFRYSIMPGYPQETPFESIEKVRAYMAGTPDGSRIICLECGKAYKTLGVHLLAIHNMSTNEYHERYKIPYTYKLSCPVTSNKHSIASKELREKGIIKTPSAAIIERMQRTPKRPTVFKKEISISNLPKPIHGRKSKAYMEAHTAKRGTPEYHEKMRNRPQVGKYLDLAYWKGRKQSPEHISKRIANGLATRAKRKLEPDEQYKGEYRGSTDPRSTDGIKPR